MGTSMIENIKTYAFSYKEIEHMVAQYNSNLEVDYTGGVVSLLENNEQSSVSLIDIINKLFPEHNIAKDAIVMYVDIGYIYTRQGAEILVIDGVQE